MRRAFVATTLLLPDLLPGALCQTPEQQDGSGAQRGNPECWVGVFSYEICCLPPPKGNPFCWDEYYSAELCCEAPDTPAASTDSRPPSHPVPVIAAPMPPAALPYVEEQDQDPGWFGGCEWNYFQSFKGN